MNFNVLGLNRTQEQGGATTANTQSSVANPQNLTQVLVRDRLRYYNNGIEGDLLNGLDISILRSFVNLLIFLSLFS
jgi:hypothetical protein